MTRPHARALLERIAVEESEHAQLAFRFVRWAIERDPSLLPRCEAAFADVLDEAAPGTFAALNPADGALRAAACFPTRSATSCAGAAWSRSWRRAWTPVSAPDRSLTFSKIAQGFPTRR